MHVQKAFSHFDGAQWDRVQAERNRLGMVTRTERGDLVESHPLFGKTLVNRVTGNSYKVETVKKDWCNGWFLKCFMVDQSGSHLVGFVENLSSTNPDVLDDIEEFHHSFGFAQ